MKKASQAVAHFIAVRLEVDPADKNAPAHFGVAAGELERFALDRTARSTTQDQKLRKYANWLKGKTDPRLSTVMPLLIATGLVDDKLARRWNEAQRPGRQLKDATVLAADEEATQEAGG